MSKTIRALAAFPLLLASGLSMAGGMFPDYGRTIRVEPLMQEVTTQVQVCQDGYAEVQQPQQPSGLGGLIGGVLGGVAGHQVGKGSGNTAATIAGALGGAYLGSRVEANQQGSAGQEYVPTRACHMEDRLTQRPDGFRVTYVYAGHEFTERMPYDPGARVPVNITVAARR